MSFSLSISSLGKNVEVPFCLHDFQAASEAGLSFGQWLNRKVPTDERDPGTAFEQCKAITGFTHMGDGKFATMADIVTDKAALSSAIVRPDGVDRTPAGRFFFVPAIMEWIYSDLVSDGNAYIQAIMSAVANTRSINSPAYDRVIVGVSNPRNSPAMPTSQLSEPARLLTFTTANVRRNLPVWAVGLEISDQAAQAASVDQVQINLRAHSQGERLRRINSDLLGILNGNADAGEAGVIGDAVTVASLDPAATGPISQRAWVKWQWSDLLNRQITHVFGNIDTYLDLEARTGKPTSNSGELAKQAGNLNVIPALGLELVAGTIKFIPMQDWPADTLMGVDSSKAMQRVVNVSAAYQGVEEYVSRRSTFFRVDTSERIESIGYKDAFSVLTLNSGSGST